MVDGQGCSLGHHPTSGVHAKSISRGALNPLSHCLCLSKMLTTKYRKARAVLALNRTIKTFKTKPAANSYDVASSRITYNLTRWTFGEEKKEAMGVSLWERKWPPWWALGFVALNALAMMISVLIISN